MICLSTFYKKTLGGLSTVISKASFIGKYWMPNATSTDYEQRVLPAYGVHADTEITAR